MPSLSISISIGARLAEQLASVVTSSTATKLCFSCGEKKKTAELRRQHFVSLHASFSILLGFFIVLICLNPIELCHTNIPLLCSIKLTNETLESLNCCAFPLSFLSRSWSRSLSFCPSQPDDVVSSWHIS